MITLDITPDGGDTYRITAKTRHIVQWERLGKGRSLSRLERPTLTDLVEIAHVTAQREGHFAGTFSDFVDSNEVKAVDLDGETKAAAEADGGDQGDDESGPTQPAL
jgi:hypothetical protein